VRSTATSGKAQLGGEACCAYVYPARLNYVRFLANELEGPRRDERVVTVGESEWGRASRRLG
jgi:hypothetical protein